MLFNTAYTNKDDQQLIADLIGKPFSTLEKLKRKGVGSKRMIVEEVSPKFIQALSAHQDITYSSIELRTGGILVHFNSGPKRFAWAIPYYQLVIYKTNGSSIHANGNFVHFKNNKQFKENEKFFKQLMQEKIDFDYKHRAPFMLGF